MLQTLKRAVDAQKLSTITDIPENLRHGIVNIIIQYSTQSLAVQETSEDVSMQALENIWKISERHIMPQEERKEKARRRLAEIKVEIANTPPEKRWEKEKLGVEIHYLENAINGKYD